MDPADPCWWFGRLDYYHTWLRLHFFKSGKWLVLWILTGGSQSCSFWTIVHLRRQGKVNIIVLSTFIRSVMVGVFNNGTESSGIKKRTSPTFYFKTIIFDIFFLYSLSSSFLSCPSPPDVDRLCAPAAVAPLLFSCHLLTSGQGKTTVGSTCIVLLTAPLKSRFCSHQPRNSKQYYCYTESGQERWEGRYEQQALLTKESPQVDWLPEGPTIYSDSNFIFYHFSSQHHCKSITSWHSEKTDVHLWPQE